MHYDIRIFGGTIFNGGGHASKNTDQIDPAKDLLPGWLLRNDAATY